MRREKSELVYSTDKPIPRKKALEKVQQVNVNFHQQTVTVRLERKGRGGKSVTVTEGLQMPRDKQEILLKQLKTVLGTGDTVKNAVLEIQGDHRDAIIGIMEKIGYKTKRSGG